MVVGNDIDPGYEQKKGDLLGSTRACQSFRRNLDANSFMTVTLPDTTSWFLLRDA
jgi:hypothetical protein